jgi:hypothetical protein
MSLRRLLGLCGVMLVSGCLYHAREQTDLALTELAARPYDPRPLSPEAGARGVRTIG